MLNPPFLDEPTNLACTPMNSSTLMFSWTIPANGLFTVDGYHLNLQRTDNIRVETIPVRPISPTD